MRIATLLTGVPDAHPVAESIDRVLCDSHLCTLATVNGDGTPHVNTAYYAHIGNLVLYVLTAPESLHAVNWQRDPNVALSVFSSSQPWGVPHRGLQMSGKVFPLSDGDHPGAFEDYARIHPGLRAWANDGAELLDKLVSRLYSIEITHMKVTDEPVFGEEAVSVTVTRPGPSQYGREEGER